MYKGMDKAMYLITEASPLDELTYSSIVEILKKDYASPKQKINQLVKIEALIPLKKEHYLLGKKFARRPYFLESVANKMYGPSYVSLEWALQHYHLIPEGVFTVTSATNKKKAEYHTPIARFTYDHVRKEGYHIGIRLLEGLQYQKALIATKERALVDFLVLRRGRCTSDKSMREILFEDMRVEEEDLESFDCRQLEEIYAAAPHSAIYHLIRIIGELQ